VPPARIARCQIPGSGRPGRRAEMSR
jgi:hypothetical protein